MTRRVPTGYGDARATAGGPPDTDVALPVQPRRSVRQAGRLLFVPRTQLWRMAAISAASAVGFAPWYAESSLWIGPGVALSIFVAWHAVEASRVVPWIPGMSMMMACLQWILAPWAVYELQNRRVLLGMPIPEGEYFQFAVPATFALVLGLLLPLRKHGRRTMPPVHVSGSRAFRWTCELMVVGGISARLLVAPFTPSSFKFAVYLVGGLGTVGVCGLLLMNAPGWRWRAAAVVLMEAVLNTLDAQYLDMMLLVGFLAVLFVYRFQVKGRSVVAGAVLALLALLAINAMKVIYRGTLELQSVAREERLGIAGEVASGIAGAPAQVIATQNLLFNLGRLNQGGIIARVMAWVPYVEPYARGETIGTALRSALVPRALDPDKPLAGGFATYTRFTGHNLVGTTSINIGIPGEMYANFGRWGGVFAVFVYGLLLGWIFKLLMNWASRSPLWWAWAPFLLYSTVSAEMGVNEVLNQITKSFVIVTAFTFVVPTWSALRRWPRRTLTPPARAHPTTGS